MSGGGHRRGAGPPALGAPRPSFPRRPWDDAVGLGLAALVLTAWAVLLVALLRADLATAHPLALAAGVAALTFLYTGLFITAHDAMHGTLCARSPRLNDLVGRIAVTAYAAFSWERLLSAHRAHHASPAAEGDPDWHDGRHPGFWRWFGSFMGRYTTVGQMAAMTVVFVGLTLGLGLSYGNVVLGWALPSLASTLQLFYFGTWRPHREPTGGHRDRHRATSSGFGWLASFVTCYHFGYHWEHHEHPGLPWWRLPEARRAHLDGAPAPPVPAGAGDRPATA